jgi:hypothetical protein
VEGATPGRRVQFHGRYCEEAEGTDYTTWDSSHETSVILPDGSRYRGYARHKHAADASLDALSLTLAREVIALRESAGELADAAQRHADFDPILAKAIATLRAVLGESK